MFKERVAWVHFSCTKIISHLCKDLERRVKAGSVYLRNKVCHPSLPTQRVLVESTSCHTRQSLGVHKGLAVDDHWQRGVFLGLSLLWKQVGMDSTPEQAVWDSVSPVLPGEKAGMLSGRMRALNREEGTTKWQHCIWCAEDTAGVKRAWPWSCLYQIRPDLLGEGQW